MPLESWTLAEQQASGLKGIRVDGEPLESFSPTVYAYTVGLADETETLPDLTATATEPTARLAIAAPDRFPGTATITVSAADTGDTSVYTVRFLPKARPGATGKSQMKSKTVTVNGIIVSASHDDGNLPKNVLDGNLDTRWSANGTEEWIAFQFPEPRPLTDIGIAWYNGHSRQTKFRISVSSDGKSWRDVFDGWSSGKTREVETYSLDNDRPVTFVKITAFGNSQNLWNSITEVQL